MKTKTSIFTIGVPVLTAACMLLVLDAANPLCADSMQPDAEELLFIDATAPEVHRLLAGLRSGVKAVVVGHEEDFLARVNETLSSRTGVRAVHIVSHAAPGALWLGGKRMNAADLETHDSIIAGWRNGMAPDGVVAFYGCELAATEKGHNWIERFSKLAGLSVVASTDLTGDSSLGGDWLLEARTGNGVALSPFVNDLNYPAVLPAPRLEPGYQFGVYVRPGGNSYMWRFGLHNDTIVNPGLSPTTGAAYFQVPDPGFGWALERGKFQTSTDGGVNWTDYAGANGTGQTYITNAANTFWRFVDNNAGDTTTTDQIGHAINLQNGSNIGGSGTTINPDNAPTAITFGSIGIFNDTLVGGTVMPLNVTDTGLGQDGRWVLESLSVPNLLTISHTPSAGSAASFLLGSGTLPAAGSTVNVGVRYHDLYQTDSSGNPIPGSGLLANTTLTVVADAFTSLAGMTGETSVNTFTVGAQNASSTASLTTGNYAVVWRSVAQGNDTASNGGIYARIYDSSAIAQTSELRISPLDNVNQSAPTVAALSGGRFVVAYTDASNSNDIIFTIVSAAGVPGSYVTAHSVTAGAQSAPRLTTLANGNFALVWVNPDNSNDISARVFSGTDGSAIGSEFTVNTTTTGAQSQPDVDAVGAAGDFAVVWRDVVNAGDVYARRASSTGTIGSEIVVASSATNQNSPRVTGFADGRFVVCWADPGLDGDATNDNNIYLRRYAADGTAAASAARANSLVPGTQTIPAITTLGNGNFLVSWATTIHDYEGSGIFGRRFQADGTAVDTADFQINERRHFNQNQISVAPLGTAGFAASWTDSAQEGASNAGVETRTFVVSAGAPEIAVTENGNNVADGGSLAFGTTMVGTPVTKTFTITNSGTATLNLSALTVPSGFTIAQNFASSTVAASGGTTTFQITMSAGAAATPSGSLSFTTDDADENPYNFTISGTVNPAPVAINSLNRVNPTTTNLSTVNWTLTFAAANTGVTASNFSLSGAAATGASVGTPTTANAGLTWNVPVTTGSTSGTLTLNLANATGTTPGVSTSLPFAGQSYTMDKTAPTVISVVRLTPTNQGTTNASVTFRVTYSEPVTLTAPETSRYSVVAVNGSSIVGTVTSVTGSGTTRDVTANITSGSGEFRLRVID